MGVELARTSQGQRQALLDYIDREITHTTPLTALVLMDGNGAEALFLAQQNHHVMAADPCDESLELCRQQARELDLEHLMRFESFDLRRLEDVHLPHRFDLLVVGFGGLDRVPPEELAAVADALGDTVHENGRVMLVGRPRWCLWESAWFAFHFDWDRASHRLRHRSPDTEGGGWCHGWTSVYRHVRPGFEVRRLVPLGVTAPPLNLTASRFTSGQIVSTLERLERPLQKVPFLSTVSDHYLLDLRRRQDTVPGVLPAPVGVS